jgi:hypothetical protein
MEPIFFFLRRTRTQLRVLAASSFGPNDTYTPLSPRHPQARQAADLLDAFTHVCRGKHESQITAEFLVNAVRGLVMPDVSDRLKAMSKTRIVLRAK